MARAVITVSVPEEGHFHVELEDDAMGIMELAELATGIGEALAGAMELNVKITR